MPFRRYFQKKKATHDAHLRPMELDRDVSITERSTRTMVPVLFPVHEYLSRKLRPYSTWHANPYANAVHWSVAVTSLVLAVTLSIVTLLPKVHASTNVWAQTTQADFNAGTTSGVVTANASGGEVTLRVYSFANRKAVAIDNTSGGALTNYQVNVALTSSNFDFSKTQSNGNDIRFYDSNSTTALSYWTESWDSNAQTASIWVKVPSVSAATTKTIYMYYGSVDAPAASSPSNTFAKDISNVVGAWTMDEGTGTTIADSSGNNEAGTLANGPTWIAGEFGQALNFVHASTQYVNVGASSDFNYERTDSFSLGAWIKRTTSSDWTFFLSKAENAGNSAGYIFGVNPTTSHIFFQEGFSSNYFAVEGSTNVMDGTWHQVVATTDGTGAAGVKLYIDGNLETASITNDNLGTNSIKNSANVTIGSRGNGGVPFDGGIDEARIYSKVLSTNEVTALASSQPYFSTGYAGHELLRTYAATTPVISIASDTGTKVIANPSGTFVSSAFDTSEIASPDTISWDATTLGNSSIVFQIRSADTEAGLASANWYGPTGTGDYYTVSGQTVNGVHNGDRWMQYRAVFAATNDVPTLNSVAIGYNLGSQTISTDTSLGGDGVVYTVQDLTINNGTTLTIAGGTSLNVMGTLTVTGNSTILVQGKNISTTVDGQWAGAGGTINAGSVVIDSGSKISADSQGYMYGRGDGNPGKGPGGRGNAAGSYGGLGKYGVTTYGNVLAPVDLGSGGGGTWYYGDYNGGSGGGAIRMNVTGSINDNGTITANGGDTGNMTSAGSGGSIYITAQTLAGSGTITANGGNQSNGNNGGGGGRISITAATNGGFDLSKVAVSGGVVGSSNYIGQNGTAYVNVAGNLYASSDVTFPADSALSFGSLTVSNGAHMTIGGGSTVTLTGTLTVSGNSTITLQGKNTTAQVDGAWAGAGVTITAPNVSVESGSTIMADSQGYAGSGCDVSAKGPGGGPVNCNNNGVGGSYGGVGQNGGVAAYGNALLPSQLGSGGSGGYGGINGGPGGGLITMNVSGTLTNNGTITAAGSSPGNGGQYGCGGGGGSGGSIYVTTGTLAGSGSIAANGGDQVNGTVGGGGGRVAVYYATNNGFNLNSITATGGWGATNGTVYLVQNGNLTVSADLTLTSESTINLTSITVNNGATFTIGGGSVVTLTGALTVSGSSTILVQSINNTSQVNSAWVGTGSTINAGSVQVDAGSKISADGQGYSGTDCSTIGKGPGGGPINCNNNGIGGSYGGLGAGTTPAAAIYGSIFNPTDLGSGGSGAYGGGAGAVGGSGGGLLKLVVSGVITNNGSIESNGASNGCGQYACGGGGSGGTVNITAGSLSGTGSVTANGGNPSSSVGGGGGRVAINYTNGSHSTFTITAAGGNSAGVGSVSIVSNGNLLVSSDLAFPADSTIGYGGITVSNGATLTIGGGSTVNLVGALNITGNSTVLIQGKNTTDKVNGAWAGAGSTINAATLTIASGSKISADGQGYTGSRGDSAGGNGPGGGVVTGGSYGGAGSGSHVAATYGSALAPIDLGSGGGGEVSCCVVDHTGTPGGGAIHINVSGTFTNNGIITANGTSNGDTYAAEGSGGSVLIDVNTLAGNGSITANGGTRGDGLLSGGGGRIAVYYQTRSNDSTTHVAAGGTGASDGTVIFSFKPTTTLTVASDHLFNASPSLTFTVTDVDHRTLGAELEYMPKAGDSCSSQNWSPATVVESSNPAGWSGNGQYLDGNTVTYTISTITSGTYCWRTAAKALTGSFTSYGDWSSARSFVVDSGAPSTLTIVTDINNHVFTNGSDMPTTLGGQVADDSGGQGIPANAVTVTLKRLTDSQYWNSSAWVGTASTFNALNSATTGNQSVTWTAATLPTWTEGQYNLSAQAQDKVGNQTSVQTVSFVYDKTPPTAVSTVFDGTDTGKETPYVLTTSSLSANWPATTDAVSGIDKYEYAIGTAMGGSNVVGWTNNGTDLSFTKTGLSLVPGATYYVSVIAIDTVGNVSPIQVSSGTIVDTQVPAAVTDLTAQPASSTSMTVYWTAPGDDEKTGTATSYDLRMSTSPITNDNFAQATAVTNVPTPTAAGNTQQVTVSNLTTGTTYYFALKATDKVAHTSAISNIAKSETEADSIASTVPTITPITPPAPKPVEFNCLTSVASSQNTPIELNFTAAASLDQSKLTETSNAPTVTIGVRNIDQTLNDDLKSANLLGKDPTNILISPANPTQVKAITLSINSNQISLNSNSGGDGCTASVVPPNALGSYTAEANVYYKDGTIETRQIALLIDPSGYVYEKAPSGETRLSDVSVTLKVKSGDSFVTWSGSKYSQTNPQTTGVDGQYAFFVPEGTYQIVATKTGYSTYTSDDLVVTDAPVSLAIELKQTTPTILRSFEASVSGTVDAVTNAVGRVATFIKNVAARVHTATAPIATNSVAKTTQATAVVATAAVVTMAAALPAAANLPVLDLLGHLIAALASLASPRKKRKNLGLVIDSESGQPVSGAVVRILTADSAKLLETQVTDVHGTFGFLVSSGEYTIEVSKANYVFPAKLTNEGYHGSTVSISSEAPLALTIPIDPELQTLSKRLSALSSINQVMTVLRLPLLALGTVSTLVFVFGQPNMLNGLVLGFYAVSWLYELVQHLSTGRAFGAVADAMTNAGLDLAIVRLARPDGKLIASKVSNQRGHFLVQVAPGQYKVTVTRRGYQQLLNTEWQTKKHDTLSKEFKLAPKNEPKQ